MKKTYLLGLSVALAMTACSSNHDKTASEAAAEATATQEAAAPEVAEAASAPEAAPVAEAETPAPEVAEAEATPEAAPAEAEVVAVSAKSGQELYEGFCKTCHEAGIAGAPKFGDKDAWAPRIAQGKDTLYQHSIEGYQGDTGVMPPKGGSTYSDDEMKLAVDYMTSQSS